jgi:hypothetical protein
MPKDKHANNKQAKPAAGQQMDSRFAEILSDPRYMEMPQKQKKVVIDKRFQQVLDKKSGFNTISKFDKTGKRVDTQDKLMQKFYRLDE